MAGFDQAMHEFLVASYLEHVHQLYPILASDDFCLQKHQPAKTELGPRGLFIMYMVYSIACHTLPGNDPRMVLLSDTAFDAAKGSLGAVTEKADAEALQAVCLLALRSLFEPQTGNLSQQLAFAQRLLVEVKVRDIGSAGPDHHQFAPILFCLGMQSAAAYSKKSAFPQPPSLVITTVPGAAAQLHDLCVLQWKCLTRPGSAIQDLRLLPGQNAPPLFLAVHAETSFLIKPCERSALSLLSLYMREDMVFNVFTQQWVHRAVIWLVSNSRRETQQEGLHLAMRILDRCALKWSNARVLQETLQNPTGGG
ncbi:hypothetical protein HII31_12252 [Pseudocercospora fuligena]|uniref:Transcription factor domain-containing protein n=1 Tax=Pseudocercospora fuligena TaxID=685502 RepID=A0A8H6VGV2_9PEZI|nr:hypothetical protein HII31_12252 [Pseudocercospora fuligena]